MAPPSGAARLLFSQSGVLVVGSEQGLWQWNEKARRLQRLIAHRDLDKTLIQSIFNDENGLWIASNKGAFRYNEDGSCTVIPALFGIPVQAIQKDRDGNYWFVTYNKGVLILRGALALPAVAL